MGFIEGVEPVRVFIIIVIEHNVNIAGVPQGSINRPLLFNLFINDLFIFICFSALSNYADDNNLFTTGIDIQLINQMLLSDLKIVNNWFYENFMILNPGKCHFMSIGKDTHDEDVFIMISLSSKIAMKRKY